MSGNKGIMTEKIEPSYFHTQNLRLCHFQPSKLDLTVLLYNEYFLFFFFFKNFVGKLFLHSEYTIY